MIDNLYKKHHGLPGVSLFVGQNGYVGTNGNNVYFGYIGDFFNSVETTIDNIIRLAQSKDKRYTGVHNKVSLDKYEIQNTYGYQEKLNDNSDSNIFRQVYEYENFCDEDINGILDDLLKKSYAKVDVNNKGLNPNGAAESWNVNSSNGKWINKDSDIPSDTDITWPYAAYDSLIKNKTWIDIKPGKIVAVPRPDKLEDIIHTTRGLFTVNIDGMNYAFTTVESEHYNNGQPVIKFTDNRNSDNLITIHEIIAEFERHSGNATVDYLKSREYLTESIYIMDKLKSDYKVGDVLYFYTDKNAFSLYHTVEYMVVITPALLECTVDDLIANADIANPFTFKFIDDVPVYNESYLLSQKKVSTVYYRGSKDVEVQGKKFARMIGYSGKSLLNTGVMAISKEINGSVDLLRCQNSYSSFNFADVPEQKDLSVFVNPVRREDTPVLKVNNAYFRNDNIGNLEMSGMLHPLDIIIDDNGVSYTLTEDDYIYSNRQFIINPDNYFKNSTLTTSTVECVVVTFNKSEVDARDLRIYGMSDNSKIRRYTFGNESGAIQLSEDYLTETAHMIITYIKTEFGLKYNSLPTFAVYNTGLRNYEISVLGDFYEDTEEAIDEDCIFECTGISADEISDGVLNVYVPILANETIGVNFFMNSKQFDTEINNSWCSLRLITETDENGETVKFKNVTYTNGRLYHLYRFNVAVKDNIPQITAEDVKKAQDYNSKAGDDSMLNGCDVFYAIMSGHMIDTASRYVTVSVKYVDALKVEHKSVYRLEQSGYIEKRKIPKVNLKILKNLDELENSNKFSNGVLVNQFQFFIDIDIEDFNSDVWGSYEKDITLNFDINSTPVDYDFITKYGVSGAMETYTLHSIVDDDYSEPDNYCRIYASIVNNDIDSVFDVTQKDFEEFENKSEKKFICENTLKVVGASEYLDIDSRYPNITKTTFDGCNTRNSGIICISVMKFRGLTFDDVSKGKFRIRVVVEFGNPLFSRLFFRYYVSDMYVKYGSNTFHVGTANLAKAVHTGRVQSYEYMFATESLNAFICPVSLTAAPVLTDSYSDYVDVNRSLMIGSSEQIDIELSPYIPDKFVNMYKDKKSEDEIIRDMIAYQEIPWYEFNLKLRHLQDNVSNMSVKPVNIKSFVENVASMPYLDELIFDLDDAHQHSTDYLSIVYNSNAFSQRSVNDVRVFNYNNEDLEISRYSQYLKNTPIFLEQSVSYVFRDSDLINAMNVWNYEYKLSGRTDSGVFRGHLNTYGNGYNYINESADLGQFGEKVYSLQMTRDMNERMFFYKGDVVRGSILESDSDGNAPALGKWYRTLLYQAKWQYPKYYMNERQEEKIAPYDIVDVGKFIRHKSKNIIPYNLTYSLYPRCAYIDERDVAVVFMLRCPSIVKENNYEMEKRDLMFGPVSGYPQLSGDFNVL